MTITDHPSKIYTSTRLLSGLAIDGQREHSARLSALSQNVLSMSRDEFRVHKEVYDTSTFSSAKDLLFVLSVRRDRAGLVQLLKESTLTTIRSQLLTQAVLYTSDQSTDQCDEFMQVVQERCPRVLCKKAYVNACRGRNGYLQEKLYQLMLSYIPARKSGIGVCSTRARRPPIHLRKQAREDEMDNLLNQITSCKDSQAIDAVFNQDTALIQGLANRKPRLTLAELRLIDARVPMDTQAPNWFRFALRRKRFAKWILTGASEHLRPDTSLSFSHIVQHADFEILMQHLVMVPSVWRQCLKRWQRLEIFRRLRERSETRSKSEPMSVKKNSTYHGNSAYNWYYKLSQVPFPSAWLHGLIQNLAESERIALVAAGTGLFLVDTDVLLILPLADRLRYEADFYRRKSGLRPTLLSLTRYTIFEPNLGKLLDLAKEERDRNERIHIYRGLTPLLDSSRSLDMVLKWFLSHMKNELSFVRQALIDQVVRVPHEIWTAESLSLLVAITDQEASRSDKVYSYELNAKIVRLLSLARFFDTTSAEFRRWHNEISGHLAQGTGHSESAEKLSADQSNTLLNFRYQECCSDKVTKATTCAEMLIAVEDCGILDLGRALYGQKAQSLEHLPLLKKRILSLKAPAMSADYAVFLRELGLCDLSESVSRWLLAEFQSRPYMATAEITEVRRHVLYPSMEFMAFLHAQQENNNLWKNLAKVDCTKRNWPNTLQRLYLIRVASIEIRAANLIVPDLSIDSYITTQTWVKDNPAQGYRYTLHRALLSIEDAENVIPWLIEQFAKLRSSDCNRTLVDAMRRIAPAVAIRYVSDLLQAPIQSRSISQTKLLLYLLQDITPVEVNLAKLKSLYATSNSIQRDIKQVVLDVLYNMTRHDQACEDALQYYAKIFDCPSAHWSWREAFKQDMLQSLPLHCRHRYVSLFIAPYLEEDIEPRELAKGHHLWDAQQLLSCGAAYVSESYIERAYSVLVEMIELEDSTGESTYRFEQFSHALCLISEFLAVSNDATGHWTSRYLGLYETIQTKYSMNASDFDIADRFSKRMSQFLTTINQIQQRLWSCSDSPAAAWLSLISTLVTKFWSNGLSPHLIIEHLNDKIGIALHHLAYNCKQSTRHNILPKLKELRDSVLRGLHAKPLEFSQHIEDESFDIFFFKILKSQWPCVTLITDAGPTLRQEPDDGIHQNFVTALLCWCAEATENAVMKKDLLTKIRTRSMQNYRHALIVNNVRDGMSQY